MGQPRVISRLKPQPRYGETQIRAWRTHRSLTLEQLAERVGVTHATLSRIERGKQPYNQVLLESLADALGTDVASLLIRNPDDPDGIWSIWDHATRAQRRQLVDIAKTLLRAS
jgi:transcriptional regulator with XRE-family HTH domain